jgi:uncharacterized protein (TIGR02444 family)
LSKYIRGKEQGTCEQAKCYVDNGFNGAFDCDDFPLWRFSLAFYGDRETARLLLALQDEQGVDVCLMLYFIYQSCTSIDSSDWCWTGERVRECMDAVGSWRAHLVQPLRTLRQQLKHHANLPGKGWPLEAFRSQVQALELAAEKSQLFFLSQGDDVSIVKARGDVFDLTRYRQLSGWYFHQLDKECGRLDRYKSVSKRVVDEEGVLARRAELEFQCIKMAAVSFRAAI